MIKSIGSGGQLVTELGYGSVLQDPGHLGAL